MTNPLQRQRGTSANYGQPMLVNGQPVPTEINDYCAWLNGRERRHGMWRVVERDGYRQVEFMQERGSTDWLREKGFAPRIGSSA